MIGQNMVYQKRSSLATALVITRRELRDHWRDWRIIAPIIILTLIFPWLMTFTSRWATQWVAQLSGTTVLAERINPFLTMIVGFFPLSFSLIIALESFVGEKERNSLEPILAMPVSDLELYLGKLFSSLLLPLLASYLGVIVFLVSRLLTASPWLPPLELISLVFLLNTVEALVMVASAVVISGQTTSIRAANLLASFIIIPMALLVQAESVIMFYAEYEALWWIVLALLVVSLMMVRMGVRIFNREEILSKELDELNLKGIWRDFKGYFLRSPDEAVRPAGSPVAGFSLLRFYWRDLPLLLRQQTLPFTVVMLVTISAVIVGIGLARQYPFPPEALPLHKISAGTFAGLHGVQPLPGISTSFIFLNNLRVTVLAGLLSLFSFGSLALCLDFINLGLVGFIVAQVVNLGHNPWLFIATFILPHGLLEIPALLLATTFALRMGAALVAPPTGLNIGQGLLLTSANFIKTLLLVVIPLLLLAAFIEANLTPQLVVAVYSR